MSEPSHDNQNKNESDSPSAWRPPEPRPGRGFWGMMAFSLVAVGGLAYLQYMRVDKIRRGGAYATPVSNLPVLGHVPDFDLIERNGQAVTLSDLRGKVWIADFIFTSCGGPCPIMTRRMGELHRTLKREALSGVTTVSISVDPLRDSPKQLMEYATIHRADDEDWLFLTGGEKAIRDLSVGGFKLPVEPE
ncbi:MAG: SCO family protein, partial [Phycisphaerae bacterium]